MADSHDFEAFAIELGKTAELFGEPMSASRILLYFEAIERLPADGVLWALRESRRACPRFPAPAVLRDLLGARPVTALPARAHLALPAADLTAARAHGLRAVRELIRRCLPGDARRGSARPVAVLDAEVARLRARDAADPDLLERKRRVLEGWPPAGA